MKNMDIGRNPEQMTESPEQQISTVRENAERLKSYGGVLGAIGAFTEKQVDRVKKIDLFANAAHKAYTEGNTKRVDNMYLKGTQLEKMGALKATSTRIKCLNNAQLKEVIQDKKRGRLERACAAKVLEKRLEQKSVHETSKQEAELLQREKTDSKESETFDEVVAKYYDDLKKNSEYPETIINDGLPWIRLSPEEIAEKRTEFNTNKERLIAEWEKLNGKEWPRYKEDVYVNGKIIRKAGDRYDAHHVKPLSFGGKNEASNLTPISAEKHFDKQGIHAPTSPYGLLEKMAKGVKVNET